MAKKSKEDAGPTGPLAPTSERGPQRYVGPPGIEGPLGPDDSGIGGEPGPGDPIEVPEEVIEALGGMPIPPPPVRPGRPQVTRVGQPLEKRRPDPGGLLAHPRPGRRDALEKIARARKDIAALVRQIEEGIEMVDQRIAAAVADAEACEAEGFSADAAAALIVDLRAALALHLGDSAS